MMPVFRAKRQSFALRLPSGFYQSLRVARTLICMYAPHEQGQHLCHRVLSVAGSGFSGPGAHTMSFNSSGCLSNS